MSVLLLGGRKYLCLRVISAVRGTEELQTSVKDAVVHMGSHQQLPLKEMSRLKVFKGI